MRTAVSKGVSRIPIMLAAILVASLVFPQLTTRITAQMKRQQPRQQASVAAWPAKSKRFALIIGVDDYEDSQISKLEGASNDAKSLAQALIGYAGFPDDQVILLASDQPLERRPTRGNILARLSYLKGLVPEDGLLLVFFAGHGMERGKQAFLCPADAQSGNIDLLKDTAIPVDEMRDQILRTRVKQVVIILDACRNDPAGRGQSQDQLTENYTRHFNFDVQNREVTAFATLYATDIGNVAYEYKEKKQGYFTWALVEGIKGKAANEKGEVTLEGLKKYLEDAVPKQVGLDLGQQRKQRPWAEIQGYKAEDLVISITARAAESPVTRVAGVDPAAIELSFWETIKNSNDPDDFSEYLKKYGDRGQFAGLARNKLKNLMASSRHGRASPGDAKHTEPGPAESKPAESKPPVSPGFPVKLNAGPGGAPLASYGFDTVNLDSRGIVVNRRRSEARSFAQELGGGARLEMVAIPAGTFTMGSPKSDNRSVSREVPEHHVTVQAFYMGRFEVTQAQWRAVAMLPKVDRDLNADPSHFKGNNLPVEQVSWEDAVEFCKRLSRKTGLNYRLPSEAEWEYACRAGTKTAFAFGDTISPDLANYNASLPTSATAKGGSAKGGAASGTNRGKTVPVGSLGVANGFGLSDMHGNVWEWCLDTWHWNYVGAPADGSAWVNGGDQVQRVMRGGSYSQAGDPSRSAFRSHEAFDSRVQALGFRVVVGA
jgi:formylglycine-generating enzyme required for sulfatase activity